MRITTRQHSHVVVIELIGRLTGSKAAREILEALRALGRAGTRTIVVSLARLRAIDEAGLAALSDGHSELRSAGGELRLAAFSRGLGDLVVARRLATMCNVFESVEQAMEGAIGLGPTGTVALPRPGTC